MNYSSLLKYLFSLNNAGIRLDLRNMKKMQQILHFPDQSFRSIHIAGTNGKGSTCIKIATALELEGYRVGLYTSPHLSCFRERIRINQKMIPEEDLKRLLQNLIQLLEKEKIPLTFFEIVTLLAFVYFSEKKVDFAVIETGLGGRLDATNVITPILSVITSISLDHVEHLGNDLLSITKEKGGIIKQGVPVVIGPKVPYSPIEEIANANKSSLLQVTSLNTDFEKENCSIAKTALEVIRKKISLSDASIEKGMQKKQPSRCEILEGSPLIVLDVAHNPDGLLHLFKSLKKQFPHAKFSVLFGLSKNKDILECLKILSHEGSHFYIVEAANGRGAQRDLLAKRLKEMGKSSSVHSSIPLAIDLAKKEAEALNEILVICGSFFIMGEARFHLGLDHLQDPIDLNESTLEIKK